MRKQICLLTPALSVQLQASLQHHLPFRNEAYILTLYANTAGMQPAHVIKPTERSLCALMSSFSAHLDNLMIEVAPTATVQ